MAGVNKLRFLKRDNLRSEQRIQKEYYRDLINAYGIDVMYFRKDFAFYDVPSGYCNYTYGEDTTATYYLSAPMVVYMEMLGDSFLLNKFGIETDGDAAIFFTIDDFYEQYRDMIGTTTNSVLTSELVANMQNFSGMMSGNMMANDLSAFTSATIVEGASGYVSGTYMGDTNPLYRKVNPDIKWPNYYEEYGIRYLAGIFSGTYEGYLDVSGNGILTGMVSGDGYFFRSPAVNTGPFWEVDPQVGDFFRLDFEPPDEAGITSQPRNLEEYEITRVHDRDLQTDGLNPLLGKYIWRCDVVRRDPSYEEVPGDLQEEARTVSKLNENTWAEDTSNAIFDYTEEPVDTIDLENADSVYGSYGSS